MNYQSYAYGDFRIKKNQNIIQHNLLFIDEQMEAQTGQVSNGFKTSFNQIQSHDSQDLKPGRTSQEKQYLKENLQTSGYQCNDALEEEPVLRKAVGLGNSRSPEFGSSKAHSRIEKMKHGKCLGKNKKGYCHAEPYRPNFKLHANRGRH